MATLVVDKARLVPVTHVKRQTYLANLATQITNTKLMRDNAWKRVMAMCENWKQTRNVERLRWQISLWEDYDERIKALELSYEQAHQAFAPRKGSAKQGDW